MSLVSLVSCLAQTKLLMIDFDQGNQAMTRWASVNIEYIFSWYEQINGVIWTTSQSGELFSSDQIVDD